MSELRSCPECKRHIRVDERACPFCASTVEQPARPRRLSVGRLTRAAVFSGALLGVAACGGGDDEIRVDASVSDDGSTPDADPTAPDADPTPDSSVPLPYGAPPARSRIV